MKKLGLKILLIGALVWLLQSVVKQNQEITPSEIGQVIDRETEEVADGAGVVLLGDSVLAAYDVDDSNLGSIGDFLEATSGARIAEINHAGMDMKEMRMVLERVVSKIEIDTVVVELNMRSLSTLWFNRPGYWLKDEIVAEEFAENDWLRPWWWPVVSLSNWVRPIPEDSFGLRPTFSHGEFLGRVSEVDKIKKRPVNEADMRLLVRANYLYRLDEWNPVFGELVSLNEIVRQQQAELVVFVTPVDVDFVRLLVREAGVEQIRENIELIALFAAENEFVLVDLSEGLGSEHFYHQGVPDEHLDEAGRRWVAEQLAKAIREE